MKKNKIKFIATLVCLVIAAFAIVPGNMTENVYAENTSVRPVTIHKNTVNEVNQSTDGYFAKKYLEANYDGSVTITMESWVANDGTVEIPSYDIIILFDQSDSANAERNAIFESAQSFLTNLNEDYSKGGLKATQGDGHRVSIVGYGRIGNDGSGDYNYDDYATFNGKHITASNNEGDSNYNFNTGFYKADGSFVSGDRNYWTEVTDFGSAGTLPAYNNQINYSDAFMSVDEAKNVINDDHIAKWWSNAARLDCGLVLTNEILQTADSPDRKKMVLVFSNSCAVQNAGETLNSRLSQISTAMNNIRANVDAVLSVGKYNVLWPTFETDSAENYKNQMQEMTGSLQLDSTTNTYICKKDKNYTFDLSNTEGLSDAFNLMLNIISSSANFVNTDIVPPQFVVPENATRGEVYTVPFTGYEGNNPTWGEQPDVTGQEFSYKTDNDGNTILELDAIVSPIPTLNKWNNTSETNRHSLIRGKKMVVKITVEPADGFIGGNNVPTNDNRSGIYINGNYSQPGSSLKVAFPQPTVNVPIIFDYDLQNQQYYFEQYLDPITVRSDWTQYLFNNSKYVLNGKNNAYVDIVYTITDQNGNQVDTVRINAGNINSTRGSSAQLSYPHKQCTKYMVSCTVTPSYETGTVSAKTISAKPAWVHIIKPKATFKDISFISKDPVNASAALVNCDWLCNCGVKYNACDGISWSYNPGESVNYSSTDVEVNATLYVNNVDKTKYVTFVRNACDVCGHSGSSHSGSDSKFEFLIHPCFADLIIEKSGLDSADPHQATIFEIYNAEDELVNTVVIYGNSSVTIKDLFMGNYRVEENTEWPWRYELKEIDDKNELPESNSKIVSLNSADETKTVSFKNGYKDGGEKWLGDESFAKNIFEKVDGEVTVEEKSETAIVNGRGGTSK